jgi:hypothetical protein
MGGGTYALRRWEWITPQTYQGLAGQEMVEAIAVDDNATTRM